MLVGYYACIEAPARAFGKPGGNVTRGDRSEQLTRRVDHRTDDTWGARLDKPTNGWSDESVCVTPAGECFTLDVL
jgi:hypothetical protein